MWFLIIIIALVAWLLHVPVIGVVGIVLVLAVIYGITYRIRHPEEYKKKPSKE